MAPFLNREATVSGDQQLDLTLVGITSISTLHPGRFVVLVGDQTVMPERVNFVSGSDDTLELQLPAGTLRAARSGWSAMCIPVARSN